jgi:quercetin dioxygenase-like cupin family protein
MSSKRRNGLGLSVAGLIVVVAACVYALPSAAADPPPPIVAETLTARAVFPDQVDLKIKLKAEGGETVVVNQDDPSRTVVVRYTVQPGAHFPWHTHLGPVVVNIVSGTLTYQASDDCAGTTYGAGQAFVDAGHGHVHSAFNAGSVPTVFVATFFGSPESGALLIPADPGC